MRAGRPRREAATPSARRRPPPHAIAPTATTDAARPSEGRYEMKTTLHGGRLASGLMALTLAAAFASPARAERRFSSEQRPAAERAPREGPAGARRAEGRAEQER